MLGLCSVTFAVSVPNLLVSHSRDLFETTCSFGSHDECLHCDIGKIQMFVRESQYSADATVEHWWMATALQIPSHTAS